MSRRINRTRRVGRGGAAPENIVQAGLVKDRIAFFEGLKKKGWSTKELNGMIPIWEGLRKKGYNNGDIEEFFDKHRGKTIDAISELADAMPNKKKPTNNSTNNSTKKNNTVPKENVGDFVAPGSINASFLKNDENVSVKNNTTAPKENVGDFVAPGSINESFLKNEEAAASKVPSDEERDALRRAKGRNGTNNTNVGPVNLFGNNTNAFEEAEGSEGTQATAVAEAGVEAEGEEANNAATSITSISELSEAAPPKPSGESQDVANVDISERLRNFNGDKDQDEEEEGNVIQSSDFAEGKGLGPSFLTLVGPWKLENEDTDTFIFCPYWTIYRAANKKIGNKAEGLVYLLLQEYAKQITQIMDSDKEDDKKLVQIIALRQFTTRTIIHFCTYCALLCNNSAVDTSYVVRNPITEEDVNSYYFNNGDVKETIKTGMFVTLTRAYIDAISTIWWKIPIQLIDIHENNAANIALTSLINAERLILEDATIQKLYAIFKSERTDEVLRFFKDPIQKEATDANTLLGLDVIYSSSISPVRFVNLIELSEYIEKTYFTAPSA